MKVHRYFLRSAGGIGAVIIGAVGLAGCGQPANATPCHSFETQYNTLADNVKAATAAGVTDPGRLKAAYQSMVAAAVDGAKTATGAVSSKLSDVAYNGGDYLLSSSEDSGVATLMAAGQVATACKSDGVNIVLHEFK